MSQHDLKSFLKIVSNDEVLKGKLKADGSDPVAIAREIGLTISADDLLALTIVGLSEAGITGEDLEGKIQACGGTIANETLC